MSVLTAGTLLIGLPDRTWADVPLTVSGTVLLMPEPWPQGATVSLTDASGNVLASETLDDVPASSAPDALASRAFQLTVPAPGTYSLRVAVVNFVPNVTPSGIDNSNPSQNIVVFPVTVGTTSVSGLEIPFDFGPVRLHAAATTVAPGQATEVTLQLPRPFLSSTPTTLVVQSTPGVTLTAESSNVSLGFDS